MRILVCGDRNWKDKMEIMRQILIHTGFTFDVTIIEGEAPGADTLSREVAISLGMAVEGYPANWKKYHKAAGHIRNQQMIDEGKPDLILAFHNDIKNSKGTKGMLELARKHNIPFKLFSYSNVDHDAVSFSSLD